MFLTIAIGVLTTGLLAIRFRKQPEDTRNETFLVGALSGHAAFVPIFIVMLAISILETEIGSAANVISSMLPGISATIPFVVVGEYLCFCLPVGGFISGILSGLGALGYAYSAHRIRSEKDDVLGASEPPTPWKG
jgi:FtsH-binding integral membrane protein